MLKPLEQWYCDVCGNVINDVSDGYVIWKSNQNYKSTDFKIIHKIQCDDGNYTSSGALRDFIGIDGLIKLTSFLSIGPLKTAIGITPYCDIANTDEFVDFIRRLQIPHYEEARRKFSDHNVLDWHSDSNEVGPYIADGLKRIIEM